MVKQKCLLKCDSPLAIANTTTKFQIWLTSTIEYGLCTYAQGSQLSKDYPPPTCPFSC